MVVREREKQYTNLNYENGSRDDDDDMIEKNLFRMCREVVEEKKRKRTMNSAPPIRSACSPHRINIITLKRLLQKLSYTHIPLKTALVL